MSRVYPPLEKCWRDLTVRKRVEVQQLLTRMTIFLDTTEVMFKDEILRDVVSGDRGDVVVFSLNDFAGRAVTFAAPGPSLVKDAVELGRLVLLDEVPGNGESWFIARCFELLRREGIVGVLSFSDPVPRTTADGRKVLPGIPPGFLR